MRDKRRIYRILQKLDELWMVRSDERLGQLLSNLLGTGIQDVFHIEDDEWERLIDDALKPYQPELDE